MLRKTISALLVLASIGLLVTEPAEGDRGPAYRSRKKKILNRLREAGSWLKKAETLRRFIVDSAKADRLWPGRSEREAYMAGSRLQRALRAWQRSTAWLRKDLGSTIAADVKNRAVYNVSKKGARNLGDRMVREGKRVARKSVSHFRGSWGGRMKRRGHKVVSWGRKQYDRLRKRGGKKGDHLKKKRPRTWSERARDYLPWRKRSR